MSQTRSLSPLVLGTALLFPFACADGDTRESADGSGSGQVTTVASATTPGVTTVGEGSMGDLTEAGSASESVSQGTSSGETQGVDDTAGDDTTGVAETGPDTTDPTVDPSTTTTTNTTSDDTTDGSCAEVKVEAQNIKTPADIIFVIDNSGSMGFEEGEVQNNMNKFSQQIVASGIDAHVVLLSNYNICIPAPLGSGGCPNLDTKLPNYLHIDQTISSNNALQKLIERKADWEPMMRPNGLKHVVVVSDDNSDMAAGTFHAMFQAYGPEYASYKFHAIVGLLDPNSFLECASDPVCCALIAEDGSQYISLAGLTGGVVGPLCDNGKQDFSGLFTALSTEVISGAQIECEWVIPDAMGMDIDFNKVNVDYLDGMNAPQAIPKVDDMAACMDLKAWYYDDPVNPTKIFACPSLCTQIQGNEAAQVDVKFGCESIIPQ